MLNYKQQIRKPACVLMNSHIIKTTKKHTGFTGKYCLRRTSVISLPGYKKLRTSKNFFLLFSIALSLSLSF